MIWDLLKCRISKPRSWSLWSFGLSLWQINKHGVWFKTWMKLMLVMNVYDFIEAVSWKMFSWSTPIVNYWYCILQYSFDMSMVTRRLVTFKTYLCSSHLCWNVLGRQNGPQISGSPLLNYNLILHSLLGSLLLLFYPPVLPSPPQKIFLRFSQDGLRWNHGAYWGRPGRTPCHVYGALNLGARFFYMTKCGIRSLTKWLNG